MNEYARDDGEQYTQQDALLPLLRGKRILHINSAATGGGVAEMLSGQIAFECALGIESRWYVIEDAADFFVITKKIHNSLQGDAIDLSPAERESYCALERSLAESFQALLGEFHPDLIILHDPQPLPLISMVRRTALTIVRLHIDLSTPYMPTVDFLMPFLSQASRIILSSDNYRAALDPYPAGQVTIIRPAIDPLTEKNRFLPSKEASEILMRHGIDTTRPFITQISRFDEWKDPLGALEAYRFTKRSVPGLQIVLAGFIEAADDPEAQAWVRKVRDAAGEDPDCIIFSDLSQLRELSSDDLLINALNTLTSATLQMSRREGFGLTITEAMWKGRVVVARPSRGALLQIDHGENGYIADTPEIAAGHIVDLLSKKVSAGEIGMAAHSSVQEHFLLTRYITLHLEAYRETLSI
jgi:trehalose synthase